MASDSPAAWLARHILEQPAVIQLLGDDDHALEMNLGEARAAYFVMEAANALSAPGDESLQTKNLRIVPRQIC